MKFDKAAQEIATAETVDQMKLFPMERNKTLFKKKSLFLCVGYLVHQNITKTTPNFKIVHKTNVSPILIVCVFF